MDGLNLNAATNPVRCEDLDIKVMPDGYIVHQAKRDRIHYLNHIAALVWELCDGSTNAEEISRILGDAFDLPELPTADVDGCLEKLVAEGLIEFGVV